MTSIGGIFDVLVTNPKDIADLIHLFGGLQATMKFAASAGPDLVRIMKTLAAHQDPVAAASTAAATLEYTQQTMDRVKAFQAANGLTVDGIIGDETWAAAERHMRG